MKKIYLFFLIILTLNNFDFLYAQTSNLIDEVINLEKDGKYKEAIELCKKAMQIQDLNLKRNIFQIMVSLYKKQKRYKEALESCEEYLKIVKDPFEITIVKQNIVDIYIEKKDYISALKILDEIIEEYPKTQFYADAQFKKASIYKNFIKDYEKAIIEFYKIIEEYPESWMVKTPFVLEKIAACYIETKRYDEAISIYKKIINKHPNSPFEKVSKLMIEFIEEYLKKGKDIPPEVIIRKMKEVGLGEGIISIEEVDGKLIYKAK